MRGEKEVILLVGWVGVFRLFCNLSGGKKINKYPKARSRGERGGGVGVMLRPDRGTERLPKPQILRGGGN